MHMIVLAFKSGKLFSHGKHILRLWGIINILEGLWFKVGMGWGVDRENGS